MSQLLLPQTDEQVSEFANTASTPLWVSNLEHFEVIHLSDLSHEEETVQVGVHLVQVGRVEDRLYHLDVAAWEVKVLQVWNILSLDNDQVLCDKAGKFILLSLSQALAKGVGALHDVCLV